MKTLLNDLSKLDIHAKILRKEGLTVYFRVYRRSNGYLLASEDNIEALKAEMKKFIKITSNEDYYHPDECYVAIDVSVLKHSNRAMLR